MSLQSGFSPNLLNDFVDQLVNKPIFCFGFLFFTKSVIRAFLAEEQADLIFVGAAAEALKKGFDSTCHIAAWGRRGEQEARRLSQQSGVPVWVVEDGFLRSAGLGSDYSPPASLVLDKQGIYYDPGAPSDLEMLLSNHDFNDALLDRAQQIQNFLVKRSISKYNLGASITENLREQAGGRPVLLIPGQVENDASITKGCIDIRTNTGLIIAARNTRPDAFLIYKPHPDVISGNRKGHVPASVINDYCDACLEDVSITDCLDLADEVHTMTSLVGMEALLRHCKVHCYGLPFYAGWGLTHDRHPVARRKRKLSLQQLVAAAYILYPRYVLWPQGELTTPEVIIDGLSRELDQQGGRQRARTSRAKRQLRKLLNIGKGIWRDLKNPRY